MCIGASSSCSATGSANALLLRTQPAHLPHNRGLRPLLPPRRPVVSELRKVASAGACVARPVQICQACQACQCASHPGMHGKAGEASTVQPVHWGLLATNLRSPPRDLLSGCQDIILKAVQCRPVRGFGQRRRAPLQKERCTLRLPFVSCRYQRCELRVELVITTRPRPHGTCTVLILFLVYRIGYNQLVCCACGGPCVGCSTLFQRFECVITP